jgi:hypothetical protein
MEATARSVAHCRQPAVEPEGALEPIRVQGSSGLVDVIGSVTRAYGSNISVKRSDIVEPVVIQRFCIADMMR